MKLSDIEYFTLRFIRKYIFSTQLLVKIGKYIPYYQTNTGYANPEKIAKEYQRYCSEKDISLDGKSILEIGTGAINSIAYEICGLYNPEKYYSFEPFIKFDSVTDAKFLTNTKLKYSKSFENTHQRIDLLTIIPDNSIDLILSNSVLEHVENMEKLVQELTKCLKPGGSMIHSVDYRDHFFKYPYHFLKYSEKIWKRFLNPGDLPRWRVSDHIHAFERAGYEVEILNQESDNEAFAKIESKIHNQFRHYDSNNLLTTSAVLYVKKKAPTH